MNSGRRWSRALFNRLSPVRRPKRETHPRPLRAERARNIFEKETVPGILPPSVGDRRMQMTSHKRRIRELLVRAWSPYLAVAMLFWSVEIAIFVGVARTFFPEVDLNSWTCIVAMTPPLLVALYVNFFVGTVLFVRAFSRRKGRAKTLHYLFPEGEVGKLRVIRWILLKMAGVREESEADTDSR
jgi:hypothetical protein